MTRRFALIASLALVASAAAPRAHALEKDPEGYYRTGSGIRKKTVAFVKVDVYAIAHYVRDLPKEKSKAAMIALQSDKKFAWRMLRDVDHEKIVEALRGGYAMNGYKDEAKINRFVTAFSGDLKKGQIVSIRYVAATKTTSLSITGGGNASVEGEDFMRGTWSIWFGNIDQRNLGDDLIKELP
ncbi:MAG: chalcone isomerase family protein [Polyangiales bacterium]